jgi:16S rRNA processing protein RimM
MDLESLHRIGKLGKPWGHQGELTVHLEDADLDELVHAGCFFVGIEGQKVPFFFSKLHDKGRDVLVKFEDFNDPQSASVLVGLDLYAPPGLLVDGSDESWDPEECIGMLVSDEAHGELGEVTAIEGTDKNPVLVVQHPGHRPGAEHAAGAHASGPDRVVPQLVQEKISMRCPLG